MEQTAYGLLMALENLIIEDSWKQLIPRNQRTWESWKNCEFDEMKIVKNGQMCVIELEFIWNGLRKWKIIFYANSLSANNIAAVAIGI